jgi:dipicolinate synthase subunit A
MSNNALKPLFICTGADRRQLYAAARLSLFADVYLYKTDGCLDGLNRVESLDEIPRPADMLVLPVPCGSGISIPCSQGTLSCSDFVGCLKRNAIVTGGKMPVAMIEYFHSRGFDTADYFRREELAVKNAVPTAEGTLSLAMRELDVTVNGCRTLICGWGRVAKACAKLFSAAGARVCITARSPAALAESESFGFESFDISQIFARAGGFRLIINTVPAMALTRETICETRKDCLIIDLASKPGGTDFDACAELSRRAIHALSLPGKCAPVTAGEIIADTVLNIYHERSGRNVT